MRRALGGVVGAAVLGAAVMTGCGSSSAPQSSAPQSSAPQSSASHPSAAAASPRTLAPGAVPYLPSTRKALSASFLARESQVPGLAGRLAGWGYVAGAQRYFQGESRKLQVVDARTLRFRGAPGASAFIGFMRGHLNAYLGAFSNVRSFVLGGRSGIVAAGQECQCHLANPSYLALLDRAGTVTWLEINGPGATRALLAALLARAP
jgi:hypothetical protein